MWGDVRPGREAAGMANYRETTEALTQLQAEGKIRDFAWYFAAQSGPNFCIIRGETEALMEFSAAPEVMASNMKAALVNEDFQWGLYVTGEAVDGMMGLFMQTAEQVTSAVVVCEAVTT
jgi:hypothetical protein